MKETCRHAIEAGLDTLVFTEHKDFIIEFETEDYFDYDEYIAGIEECRDAFADQITIKTGIEVDFTTDYRDEVLDFMEQYTFDYTIGSVHYLGIEPISEPRADEFFKRTPKEEVMDFYWRELTVCTELGIFDTIAHLDMVKRFSIPFYGPFDPDPYMEQITEILTIIRDTDTALEINTSGLRHECKEIYPCRSILEAYKSIGGSLTAVGSDAHDPGHAGYMFEQAEALINEFGFHVINSQ
jgi:histidinol-phosphatase (PHP family)